jgi:hypothetical protein
MREKEVEDRCPQCGSVHKDWLEEFICRIRPASLPVDRGAPDEREKLLRACMVAAVRLAITRHNLELDPDAATEEEIAEDAAGACFGEECCNDKPIPEVTALLAYRAGAAQKEK